MKTKLLVLVLLAGSSLFGAARFGFSIGFGGYGYPPPYRYYAPPPIYYARPVYYAPRAPGYGYTWIDGYWYPAGPRWAWHNGYWARPPFRGAYWVRPRYANRVYYRGYWRRR